MSVREGKTDGQSGPKGHWRQRIQGKKGKTKLAERDRDRAVEETRLLQPRAVARTLCGI